MTQRGRASPSRSAWSKGHARRVAANDLVEALVERARSLPVDGDYVLTIALGTWIGEGDENAAWWFWRLGADQDSGHDDEFDQLFRHHVARAYQLAGLCAPPSLARVAGPPLAIWTFTRKLPRVRRDHVLVVRTNCPGSLTWRVDDGETVRAMLAPTGGVLAGARRFQVAVGPFPTGGLTCSRKPHGPGRAIRTDGAGAPLATRTVMMPRILFTLVLTLAAGLASACTRDSGDGSSQAAASPATSHELASGLTHVDDPSLVCMVNNMYIEGRQGDRGDRAGRRGQRPLLRERDEPAQIWRCTMIADLGQAALTAKILSIDSGRPHAAMAAG